MYLSRFELDHTRATPRDAHLLASAGGAHTLVWEWFSNEQRKARDFLFRVDTGGGVRIWTLSPDEPSRVPRAWRCASKHFAPRLSVGDRLAFLVTVNPTFRADRGPGAGKRHDVVMEEKRRLRADSRTESEAVIAQRAGAEWLRKRTDRLGCTFEDRSLRAEGYRVQRFPRPDQLSASVAMLDLQGLLVVTQPDVLVESIRNGIGPAKAFGCGLMLIRRI